MAVFRDVMPDFELFQPATIDEAVGLLDKYGKSAWVMAGGLDTFDWLKDRIKRPKVVVDMSQVKELVGVKDWNGGVEIGAMTTLTDVVKNPIIKEKFALLSTGAEAAASPQIRNQGTIGGNVSQDARCWYYRSGWKCYRAGGNTCFADTPTAINREHAIFDANRCVAVNISDSAPALIALDAKMVIRNKGGEKVVDAQDYFIGPALDITRMTILKPGDLLVAIRIPSTWAGAQFYFEKNPRPSSMGFPAGQYRCRDEGRRQQHQRNSHGRQRHRGSSGPPRPGGSCRYRKAAQRRNRRCGGQTRHRRRCAAQAQRL